MEPIEPQASRSCELLDRGERDLLAAGLLAVFAVVSAMLHFRLKLVGGYPETPVPRAELARGAPDLLFGTGLIGWLIIALSVIAIGAILVSTFRRGRAGTLVVRLGLAVLILGILGASIRLRDALHAGRHIGGILPPQGEWLPAWRLFREATARLGGGAAIAVILILGGVAVRWMGRRRGTIPGERPRPVKPEDFLAAIALSAIAVMIAFVARDRVHVVGLLTGPGFGEGDYGGCQTFIQAALWAALLLLLIGWARTLRRGSSTVPGNVRNWRAVAVLYSVLLLLLLLSAVNAIHGLEAPFYEWEIDGNAWRTFLGALLGAEATAHFLLGLLAFVLFALVCSFAGPAWAGRILPGLPGLLLAACALIFAVKTTMACHIIEQLGRSLTPRDISGAEAVTGSFVLLAGLLLPALLLAGRAFRSRAACRGPAHAASALGLLGLAAGLAAYVLEFHDAWDARALPGTCPEFLARMTNAASWLLAGAVLWVTGMILAGVLRLQGRRQTRISESSVP